MQYDYIIVGGGSAGSVMANRLSARSANRVLLLEAGIDTPHGAIPPDVHSSYPGTAYFNPDYTWNRLRVRLQPVNKNLPESEKPELRNYEQARIMGGGSSINGQMANRGSPNDYDDWGRQGAKGWSWEACLPFFRKLERDMDYDGALHGQEGRIPIRRVFQQEWTPYATAVAEAMTDLGYPYLTDQNGAFEDGHFPVTISNLYDRRVSTAIGYLDPPTRLRENLEVRSETQVSEILFDGLRAVGVRAERRGVSETFMASEVVLCCGAVHSPAHLLRSGIGPAGHLADMGIEVRHHLPGIGQNLMDHPSVACSTWLPDEARMTRKDARHIHVGARYSSGLHDAPQGDMFIVQVSKSGWHAVGERLGSLLVFVNKSYSTGEVRLASKDWREEPEVEFNLLSDERDLDRLKDAFLRASTINLHPAVARVAGHTFPSSYSEKVRAIGRVTKRNEMISKAVGGVLDMAGGARGMLIDRLITGGLRLSDLLEDDGALEGFVRATAVGVWHASCTNRMGADDDPMAVTDEQGRVRGVAGLRVVDASIMPSVPCANTNIPTIMMAERIADTVLSDG